MRSEQAVCKKNRLLSVRCRTEKWPDSGHIGGLIHSIAKEQPMLRSMLELKNYTIGATDGEIGHVSDFYFDDRSWVIRYLVIKTGSWHGPKHAGR